MDAHQKGETMDRIKVERAIAGLTEWQKHVQTNSDIDKDISTAIEALKAQLFSEGTTSDMIDRQQAIDGKIVIQRTNGVEIYSDEAVPVEYLKSLPPAQPELHEGHWIGSDGSYICSECNCSPLDFIDTVGASFDAYVETPMKFCPNCGTKMKGVEHETD